jgi:prepilin-type N-terminal cleavage/methylation domain-containing protein
MRFRENQKARKGFTLVEASIVLGIMGLILAAVWVAAGTVYKNQRVASASTYLLQIAQAVRNMYSGNQVLATDTTLSQWIAAGAIPKDAVVNNTATSNPWGGETNVTVSDTTTFSVLFTKVPKAACIDLLMRNTGSGRDTGLQVAGVGAVNSSTSFNFAANYDLLGDIAKSNTYCSDANNNTVYFTYTLRG